MNYDNFTNDELRERIALLKELKTLETGSTSTEVLVVEQNPKDEIEIPWYPYEGKWIEWDIKDAWNQDFRKDIADILYHGERVSRSHDDGNGNDYSSSWWDENFDGSTTDHYAQIVAVCLKD